MTAIDEAIERRRSSAISQFANTTQTSATKRLWKQIIEARNSQSSPVMGPKTTVEARRQRHASWEKRFDCMGLP
ncbi:MULTISPECIES: hypothetical protein [Bradyrhizobium]|uniref:hypothetical protein n=1 Tax=Bradyrhizobium TaxID=374 RepID=UPI001E623BF5|nr:MULTISPECIES: hypothetical protein [Bradyrhizobium]MCC8948665.1 hypothetical protein [Bradyrhizobium brasilense]